ncbi:MAG TPA: 4-hydroxy-3-methylbut-2-enyl diphosphate reductase [Candidatus Pelethocola excrementipullorum]|nr:4-hydroxy-3-methylbut-2-enyl diphosphate reductase [Candidatus Pelethocola excrementipullorum]
MEVTLAKTAGFCFGVKRAVDQVYEQASQEGQSVYTYGPIIHNDQVVHDLEQRGVQVLHGLEDLEQIQEGTVIIRSHGVGREVQEKIKSKGLRVVDATCPFVKKIHRIVEEHSKDGVYIIIVGNDNHPEVEGIKGWCRGPVSVVEEPSDLEKIPDLTGRKVCVVSQTTFNYNKFKDLVEKFSKKRYDSSVLNTICNATEERQTEARQIAGRVDAMIVIGGKHSSNTQKLYEICKKECKNTYFIETLVDLDSKPFQSFRHVGITAGASTPNKIIEEVQKRCQN